VAVSVVSVSHGVSFKPKQVDPCQLFQWCSAAIDFTAFFYTAGGGAQIGISSFLAAFLALILGALAF